MMRLNEIQKSIKSEFNKLLLNCKKTFHIILFILYYSLIICEALGIAFYIISLLCSHMRNYYFNIWLSFIKYNNFSDTITILTIILSVCISVFSMLLSIDTNSIFLQMKVKDIKIFIRRILYIVWSIVILMVAILLKSINLFFVYDLISFILIINVLIIFIQLLILINHGIFIKINNIKSSLKDNDDLFNMVKKIYDKQKDNNE